jgi:tellurite resistance protein TerC
MTSTMWMWVLFNIVVLGMLALDLGVLHRKAREVGLKEALVWSVVWTVVALLFNGVIWWWRGHDMALQFLTGYIIERTLSFDNLFVFLLVFSYFRVPSEYQHKVLFWGILGALVMRAVFIVAGIQLIMRFHWVIYVFGALLIVTGIRMLLEKDKKIEPLRNPVLRLFHRFVGTTRDYRGSRFFVRDGGRLLATPLFVVLLFVETTDLVFAVDSIPAILAISQDTFIVYTSNVFAILGLRALYFALAGIMNLFRFLNIGLSVILVFVGAKMLLDSVYEVPIGVSLGVVCGVLAASIIASLVWPAPRKPVLSGWVDTPPTDQ